MSDAKTLAILADWHVLFKPFAIRITASFLSMKHEWYQYGSHVDHLLWFWVGIPTQTNEKVPNCVISPNPFDLLFGICGSLRVFVVVLRVFAGVLRVKLVVGLQEKSHSDALTPIQESRWAARSSSVTTWVNFRQRESYWLVLNILTDFCIQNNCYHVAYFIISDCIVLITASHSWGIFSSGFWYKYRNTRGKEASTQQSSWGRPWKIWRSVDMGSTCRFCLRSNCGLPLTSSCNWRSARPKAGGYALGTTERIMQMDRYKCFIALLKVLLIEHKCLTGWYAMLLSPGSDLFPSNLYIFLSGNRQELCFANWQVSTMYQLLMETDITEQVYSNQVSSCLNGCFGLAFGLPKRAQILELVEPNSQFGYNSEVVNCWIIDTAGASTKPARM